MALVRTFALVAAFASTVGLVWPSRSLASPETDAHDLFERATQALEAGDASLARDLLQQAIGIHPSLPAYFNLAVAQRRAGQVLEAVAVLEELLRGEHGALSPEQHSAAERQRDRTREDLASVVIDYAPGPIDVRASVDGASPASIDVTTRTLLVNPGMHRIELQADGYEFDRIEVNAVRASAVRVTASFHAATLSPRNVAANASDGATLPMHDDRESGVSPWWFVAGGALAVAVVVVAIVLIAPSTNDANADATFTALTP